MSYLERQSRLCRIVNDAQRYQDVRDFIVRQAAGILSYLGIDQRDAESYIRSMIAQDHQDLSAYESYVHNWLSTRTDVYKNLPLAMLNRADAWFAKLSPYLLEDGEALDLGGGSGEVAFKIGKYTQREVTIADPLDYRRHKHIPYIPMEGTDIRAEDGQFDQTVILTVYHHTDEVEKLVAESFRVTAKRVIIIESVTEDLLMYYYGCWIDWFYNHILQFNPDIEKKVNVPCNLKSAGEWERLIGEVTGLKPKVSQNLGIFQWLNPENHYLLVYDKSN